MINKPEFQSSNPGLSTRRGEYDLLFNVHKVNLLLKNNAGRYRTPLFISIVWSALVLSRSVVRAWGRKSYLGSTEISSVVYLVKFKGDTGCIASTKSRSARGVSYQSAFIDTCLTISHTCLSCLPSRWVNPYALYPFLPWRGWWWLLWRFSTHGEYGLNSMGSWCCSGRLAWNSKTKLCCIAFRKWNVSRVSPQKLDIRYLVF